MGYRLLADTAMILHFGFLAYLVVGGFIAWRWRWTIYTHVATAAYGLGITVIGWECPLTHVENFGRDRAGDATLPSSGFIDHYLTGVVYPEENILQVQLAVAAIVAVSWAGFAYLEWRRRAARRSNTARRGGRADRHSAGRSNSARRAAAHSTAPTSAN